MSLATRCTSCGTAFRVVQDQLKISEGWVRCGRCNAVFNALEGLFDLGREEPTAWETTITTFPPPSSSPRTSESAFEQTSRNASETTDAPTPAPRPDRVEDEFGDDEGPTSSLGELLADPIDAHLFGPRKRAESAPKPAGQVGARDRVDFSDARFDSDLFTENPSPADTELILLPTADDGAPGSESAARPEFVRQADRQARWHSQTVRSALGAVSVFAILTLALQITHHWRDSLAAQYPALRSPLAAWCRLASCTIEAPRRIDDVLVESTALTRAVGQDAFVLSVNLRSRSSLPLAQPSVDLTLTDVGGRLLARRALAPRDFHSADVLPPGGEAAMQLTLTAGSAAVVGYTVEIFYP